MPGHDPVKRWKECLLDWRVLAGACAIATGAVFFAFSGAAPQEHPSAAALQPAPVPEPPLATAVAPATALPALSHAAPATPSETVASKRVKAFPAIVVDVSAETLYQRLAHADITLDRAGEVAKLHKALEPCWMASLYERMALLVPPETDPKGHAMAQRLAREQRASARPGCGELPMDVYTTADEWTARLAVQGDPQSMWDYGKSYWIRDIENVKQDPERLAEFRRITLMYLNALIDQGYTDALIAMASIRYNPTWGEPRPAEVWAYLYANAKAKGNVSSQANLLQSIDQRVPPEGRQRATDMAQELLRRCCGG